MTAHNLIISDFLRLLKDLKGRGHTLIDIEIRDDLTISIRGVDGYNDNNLKSSKKKLPPPKDDIDWEETI